MKKKMNNKGFTLVELIVVLVILAILAAILVPALLGYIDRAKKQQYVLNAKSYLTATQAEFSAMYGANKAVNQDNVDERATRIQNTADVECGGFSVTVGTGTHGAWTIATAIYQNDDGSCVLEFTDGAWVEKDSYTEKDIVIK